jgi:hypothetical protein
VKLDVIDVTEWTMGARATTLLNRDELDREPSSDAAPPGSELKKSPGEARRLIA